MNYDKVVENLLEKLSAITGDASVIHDVIVLTSLLESGIKLYNNNYKFPNIIYPESSLKTIIDRAEDFLIKNALNKIVRKGE